MTTLETTPVTPLETTIPMSASLGDLQGLIKKRLLEITHQKMIRYAAVDVHEVLNRVVQSGDPTGKYEEWTFINGLKASVTPARMRAFQKSTKCVCCGRKGNVFLLEKHMNEKQQPYINLYSVGKGGLVMMTVDHILPDSIGGKYTPANFQTMCGPCNKAKSNRMPIKDIQRVVADVDTYAKNWVDRRLLYSLLQNQLMLQQTKGFVKQLFANLYDKYRCSVRPRTPKKEIELIARTYARDLNKLLGATRQSPKLLAPVRKSALGSQYKALLGSDWDRLKVTVVDGLDFCGAVVYNTTIQLILKRTIKGVYVHPHQLQGKMPGRR